MKPTIKVKRIYDQAEQEDGHRILLDRLWTRVVSKERKAIISWEKKLKLTTELRE